VRNPALQAFFHLFWREIAPYNRFAAYFSARSRLTAVFFTYFGRNHSLQAFFRFLQQFSLLGE
jgi:hypothetical protein